MNSLGYLNFKSFVFSPSRAIRSFCRSLRRARTSLCLLIGLVVLAACNNGGTTPPSAPVAAEPDGPGIYGTGTYNASFSNERGTYTATVYYPAVSTGENVVADDSGAPYPIVAASPGLLSDKSYNKWIGLHLSTHGYIVMVFTVPNPADSSTNYQQDGLVSALDVLAGENADPGSMIYNLADPGRRAIVGHSLGAMASLHVAGRGTVDLDAVIALAPAAISTSSLENITAPTQIQGASEDCITLPGPVLTNYESTGAAMKQAFIIVGGNHVGFNDEGSLADIYGDLFVDCNNTIDVEDHQLRLSRRFMTAWLNYFVKGEIEYAGYISGGEALAEVTAGRITDLRTQGI